MKEMAPDRTLGDAVFLKYSGMTDADDQRLTGAVAEKYVRQGFRKVVLDMENVTGLLSNSISRLVEMIKSVTLAGGELFIVNVPDRVLHILRSVKLDLRLKIYLSERDFLFDYGLVNKKGPQKNRREVSGDGELRLEKTLVGDAHFIAVKGALLSDFQVGELFESARLALENGAKKLIFDLKETPYIDSTSISVFIRIRKLCLKHKSTIEIVNAGEQVADVFNLTGLASLLSSDN
jgi:anti-anti-sigma factor